MQPKDSNVPQSERAMSVLAGGLAVGCLIILFYAAQTSNLSQFASVVGVALVVACSALVSGGLLGFLFGIPRTLQQEGKQAVQQNGKAGNVPKDQRQEITYAVNTNLEQISDWLTKILVGVGLTQISTFPVALREYGDYVGTGLGGYPNSRVFSIALLLFFLIDGFLISYLWTRLHFARALRQADDESRLAAVETKLDIIDIDAKAWSLVQRLLYPTQGSSPPPQEEINAAIAPATSHMKEQIFLEAAEVRSKNWLDPADKPQMGRTIPIFRALIASDTEGVDHSSHGQLGFALKDQRPPNWSEAQAELTEAIRLRGDWQTSGVLPYYEFVRAICRINLDEAFNSGKQSDEKTKQAILSDLDVASSDSHVRELVQKEPDIKKWMKLNGVTTHRRVSRDS